MAKASKKDDKIVDVAKPGESAPDASSRPIIVGHRAFLHDPMMTPVKEEKKEEEPAHAATTAPVIKPLNDTEDADKPKEGKKVEIKPVTVVEETPKTADTPLETAEATKEDEPPTDTPAKKNESTTPPTEDTKKEIAETNTESENQTDKPASEGNTEQASKQASDKQEKEAAAKQEAINKLVTDKTYYLPIGEAKRKRNMSLVVLLIFIIIVLVVAYLAIDAGIIKTSINLPVHFFSTN